MKIEKGCLALIIRSAAGNEGKCVTVGDYLGEVYGYIGDGRWEVDILLRNTSGNYCNHIPESFLMRIDGLEENIEQECTEKENEF